MVKVDLADALRRGRTAVARYPRHAACLALAMAGLASVNLLASTALFGELADTPYLHFLLQTNELLALALALYAAYKWDTSLGMGAILLFLALLAPTFSAQFLADFPRLFHLQLVALITLFGIWLIGELRRTVKTMQQREREISAMAGLNAQVLNERASLMEAAARARQQLARFVQAMSGSSQTGSPLEVARMLVSHVQDVIGAEYVSLALIKGDVAVGERVDSYQGIESFTVTNRPAELDKLVLDGRATQYIGDTRTVVWADSLAKSGILSCLALPVRNEKRLLGILSLYWTRSNAFQEEAEFLEAISGLLAGPLLRAELRVNVGDIVHVSQASTHAPVIVRH